LKPFDPALLLPVMGELSVRVQAQAAAAGGGAHQAVRFHVSFDVSSGSPERVTVTPGRICERRVWRDALKSAPVPPVSRPDGKTPVVIQTDDRNYGSDFALLEKLAAEGIDFLVRLRIHDHPEVLEELPLSLYSRIEKPRRQGKWVFESGNGEDRSDERSSPVG
jgi:hypothetical protein